MEVRLQKNPNDCGLVCLQAFYYKYYKKWLAIERIRSQIKVSLEGVSIAQLIDLGLDLDITMEAYHADLDSVFENDHRSPAIMLISYDGIVNHYVILIKISKQRVVFLDPINGRQSISINKFKDLYKKIYISVQPNVITSRSKNVLSKETESLGFKTLFKNRSFIAILLITTIFSVSLTLIASIYTKVLLDEIIPSMKEKQLIVVTLIFILLAIFRIFNSSFTSFVRIRLETKIFADLFSNLIYKIHSTPILEWGKFNTNDRLKRAQSALVMSSFLSNFIEACFSSTIFTLVSIFTMFIIDVQMALIVIVALFVIFLLSVIQKKIIMARQQKLMWKELDWVTSFYEYVVSARDIKVSKVRFLLEKRINTNSNKLFNEKLAFADVNNLFSSFKNLFIFILPFVIYFLSSQKIMSSEMSIGSMIVFIAMFNFLSNSLDSFTTIIAGYANYRNESDFYMTFMKINNELMNLKGLTTKSISSIKLKNFSFSYSQSQKLIKIDDFEFQENTFVTGANGSGKSTLFRSIASYNQLENIFVNGIELKLLNLQDYRDNSILLSNNFFAPSISAMEWITNNDNQSVELFCKNLEKYEISTWLKDYNINLMQKIFDNGSELSSGQKQILNVLRLFSRNYQLILLDEAFENIDKFLSKKLWESILDFQKESLIIATSHTAQDFKGFQKVNIDEINSF